MRVTFGNENGRPRVHAPPSTVEMDESGAFRTAVHNDQFPGMVPVERPEKAWFKVIDTKTHISGLIDQRLAWIFRVADGAVWFRGYDVGSGSHGRLHYKKLVLDKKRSASPLRSQALKRQRHIEEQITPCVRVVVV